MNTRVVQNRLSMYRIDSAADEQRAIREIFQELVLYALSTGDFFVSAAFQGGTCLRIVHGLDRFSEDMDFVLKKADPSFSWRPSLALIELTLAQYGCQVETHDKSETDAAVRKGFVKDDSLTRILDLRFPGRTGSYRKIRIKLEIDSNPPGGSGFETRFIHFPSVSSISVQDLPSLFAGKSHAILCRQYEKGRDWYDFLWYAGRGTSINYAHLSAALRQTGPWAGTDIAADRDWYLRTMVERINRTDWKRAGKDVMDFLPAEAKRGVSLWGRELFLSALQRIG